MNAASFTGEVWRDIPGYEGSYAVSDMGRVYSYLRGRLLKPCLRASRVGLLLGGNGRRDTVDLHRLVLLAFVGPLPAGHVSRHLDGDIWNNRLSNLAYGTPRENNLDTVRHGRHREANQTHCSQGHPFDEANTYRRPDRPNSRGCRACNREAVRRYKRAAA